MIWNAYPLRHAREFCAECLGAQVRFGASIETCAFCDLDRDGAHTQADMDILLKYMREGYAAWAVRASTASVDQLIEADRLGAELFWSRIEAEP